MDNENFLYEQLARYMSLTHPTVVYHFDLSGMWTPSYRSRSLYGRINVRAWPDLLIAVASPRAAGLFIELKREGTVIYNKDGSLRASTHLKEQDAMLERLRLAGYEAHFAVGFNEAIRLIEDYLKGSLL